MRSIVAVLAVLLAVVVAEAATVSKKLAATWTYPTAEEQYLSSFEIYDISGKLVAGGIPVTARTYTATVTIDDTAVLAYNLAACGKDGTVTTPSNILVIQPKRRDLVGVGTITIKLEDVTTATGN